MGVAMTEREVRGDEATGLMQALAGRVWSLSSRWHIGDLAWDRLHITGREDNWRTRVWEERGKIIGWGWITMPQELNFQVDPNHPHLAEAILAWFEATAPDAELAVDVLDREAHLIRALEAGGYEPEMDIPYFLYNRRSLDDLPEPVLPAGFTCCPIDPVKDVGRRVAQHVAAWAPSRVTGESYRRVMSQFPYRADLDWVAKAPDGTFVTECIIWFDEANGVGEIEPTSTRAEFRRLGLGRATCLFALGHLRDLGARTAVVYCRGDDAYPVPKALYHGMGFRPYARTITYRKHRSI